MSKERNRGHKEAKKPKANKKPTQAGATFLRPQQVIRYDHDALAEVAPHIVALAESEQLPAHGEAVTARVANGVRAQRPVG